MTDFSDYIVYVDESGDARLTDFNKKFPVCVLAFCILINTGIYRSKI